MVSYLRPIYIMACLPPQSFRQAQQLYSALDTEQDTRKVGNIRSIFNKASDYKGRPTAECNDFCVKFLEQAMEDISTPNKSSRFDFDKYNEQ